MESGEFSDGDASMACCMAISLKDWQVILFSSTFYPRILPGCAQTEHGSVRASLQTSPQVYESCPYTW